MITEWNMANDLTTGLTLIIGTFLLWRNMRKQLTKINFDDGSPTTSEEPPAKPR